MTRKDKKRTGVAGFTLLETLVAVALMGIALAALGTIIAQWLPNWSLGFARVQRSDLISVSLDRIVSDLGAAEFITADRDSKLPLFSGSERSVTFVRTAYGPNARHGLEVVRIAETADSKGTLLARSTAQFAPGRPTIFTNPVVLLRAPFQLSFAYQGRDHIWKSAWQAEPEMPTIVRLTIRDATTTRALAVSTAATIHVDRPASCVRSNSERKCDDLTKAAAETAGASSPQPSTISNQNLLRGG